MLLIMNSFSSLFWRKYRVDFRYVKRFIKSLPVRPGKCSWQSIPSEQKHAWVILGWNQNMWEGFEPPPQKRSWKDMTFEQQAAVQHGLSINCDEWDNYIGAENFAAQDHEIVTRDQEHPPQMSEFVKGAWAMVRQAVPIIAPVIKSMSRGNSALNLAATGMEQLLTMEEGFHPPIRVDGVETALYLDDSGSMKAHLFQGKYALSSMEHLMQKNIRIIKFGDHKSVLSTRVSKWDSALTTVAWNASSGATYMWKMIEEDVMERYRPGSGRLRVIVITDGCDTRSPGEYNGISGMNPMMRTLLREGFDIEFHIIILGQTGLFGSLSEGDIKKYQSLAGATGGSCMVVPGYIYDPECPAAKSFVKILEESGRNDQRSIEGRKRRQLQYKEEVNCEKKVPFDWAKSLPDPDRRRR